MAWVIDIRPEDTNLFITLQENERQAKLKQLKKVMPLVSDKELDQLINYS